MAFDPYYNSLDRNHPRITKVNLIRKLKWFLNGQNGQAVLHPTKIKIIEDTIVKVAEQTNDLDAYEVFSRGFSWHPEATSPVEIQFENEYNAVLGADIVAKYVPEIYQKNRNEEEFIIKEVVFGRPLNRFNPTKTVITPIPTVTADTPNIGLQDICEARGAEIIDIAAGRDIYMLWSGGIDSTLALHSLNQAGAQFTVIFDRESQGEYEELAADIIDGKYENISMMYDPKPEEYNFLLTTNVLIVSGGNGDEIFGGEPSCAGEVTNAEQDHTLYIPEYILESTNEYVTRLVGEDNMLDLNVCEWRWAVNFIYRYQQIQISSMYMLGLDMVNSRDGHDAIHFYDTEKFNIWSIQNFRSLCGVGEDKLVAKEIIHSYDGCDRYLADKVKVCSMKKTKYRSGADYLGNAGDVNADMGRPYGNTYAATIVLNRPLRILQSGAIALALQKWD